VASVPAGVASGTILVVEDYHGVRQMTCQALMACGYTVLDAGSGETALQVAKQTEHVDLLLTDVVMPGLSGPMLAEAFNKLHPDARVLYMSGYTDETIIRYGVLHGQVPYLEKPYTPESLADRVRAVLDPKIAAKR
jgi:CheY-like chemotaxis protein